MSKRDLLERAKKHIFSTGLNDVASYLCRLNMRYGLAKIHYTQWKLGMEPNATFISAPDETVTRNKVRWENGIGYGGKVRWGDGKDKVVILDVLPNACGMLVGGLNELPKPEEVINAVYEVRSKEVTLEGVSIKWDFHVGNHFIDVFKVVRVADVKLPEYVFIIHGAAPELKGENPKGVGLYYHKSPSLEQMAKKVETPFGTCRVLVDDDAKEYLEFFRFAERFSKERRRLAAKEIFGSFQEISNEIHQGLINYNEAILGCHSFKEGVIYPIALRGDLPAYLVAGKPNFSEEVVEGLGFLRRAEKLGILERLENANIMPHGGGYTFPDMLEVSGEVVVKGKRYFIVETRSGIGQKIISDVSGLEYTYRGREVVVRALELKMCEIIARLMPVYVLKI